MNSFPTCTSAATARARGSRAASSRCWPWPRILRTGAKLLLLDEISEGLAPVIVQTLARTIRTLRERGFTIVMVEQNFRFAAPLADHFYVMEHGRIVESFSTSELSAKMGMLHEYLGV
jgi:branched-chain amino acid transport system ATP-binding protein